MQVGKVVGEITRADAVRSAQQAAAEKPREVPTTEVQRADQVNISDAGRALATSGADNGDTDAARLDSRRTDEIRSRILSGAYNSLDMADNVARSIMRSGDL